MNLYEELKFQPKDDGSKPSTLYLTVLGALVYSKPMYPSSEQNWASEILDEACVLVKLYRKESDSFASDLQNYMDSCFADFKPGEMEVIIACFYVLAYDHLSESDRKELLSIIETDGLTPHILAELVSKHTLSRPHDHELADDPEAMLDHFEKYFSSMREAISQQKKNQEEKIADMQAHIKDMQAHANEQAETIAAMREEKEALQTKLDKATKKQTILQNKLVLKGKRIEEVESMLKKEQNESKKQKSIAESRMQRLKELTEAQNNAPPAQPVQTGIDAALTFDGILDRINEMGMTYDEAKPIIHLLTKVMLDANPTKEQKCKLNDIEKRLRQRNLPSIHNQNSIFGSNVNLGNAINSQFHSSSSTPPDSSLPPSDSSSTPPDSSSEDSP